MAQKFPSIDYEDMISDLNDDLQQDFIKEDSTLYVIRQASPVFVECASREVSPVIDYFYDRPVLNKELKTMSVREAKEECRKASENLGDDQLSKAAVAVLIDDLKEYTAGNPKRNDRTCKAVYDAEQSVPLMIYFDDCDPGDAVEEISCRDLLAELKECSG